MNSLIDLVQQFWANLQQGQLPALGFWNYVILAFLMMWQGPIASLLGGAAASAGLLRPGFVFLAGVIGNLSADIVWYSVGRRGNVDRFFVSGRLNSHLPRFRRLQSGMERHGTKILLVAKLSAGFTVPTLIAAGVTRLRWRSWFPVVFIGETIWTGSLVILGFYATEAIKQIEHGIQLFLAAISFVFLAMIIWFVRRFLRQSDSMTAVPEENKN